MVQFWLKVMPAKEAARFNPTNLLMRLTDGSAMKTEEDKYFLCFEPSLCFSLSLSILFAERAFGMILALLLNSRRLPFGIRLLFSHFTPFRTITRRNDGQACPDLDGLIQVFIEFQNRSVWPDKMRSVARNAALFIILCDLFYASGVRRLKRTFSLKENFSVDQERNLKR